MSPTRGISSPPPEPTLRGSYLQSLDKGLSVLAAFRAATPLMGAAELAERAGLDRASTRRALLTLAQLGYVQQVGRLYGLTAKVLDVGHQYLSGLPFAGVAQPVLEELADQTRETASIGVLEGHDVVFILRVPAKRLLTFNPGIGSRVPAHLHSIGHVLLAALPPRQAAEVVQGLDLSPVMPQSLVSVPEVLAGIEAARSQGWALTQQQYEADYGGISVPLQNAQGQVVAALNVSFIVDRDSELRAVNDILPRLKIAARRIQQSMAGSAGAPGRRAR
jgi:IclR family pca regulon transcriptional regulator